jgi:platelet-activating factor acetylhydrolase
MVWPTPTLPAYTGPYSVGSFDIEVPSADLLPSSATSDLIPETVACRVFYPAEKEKSHTRPIYWIQDPQRGIVTAYGQFLGARPALANIFSLFPQILYYIKIPVIRNAKLLQPPTQSGKWPVMVFSHGLGSTRNTCSHICGSLASYGMVVYAMDHRDGSAPIQYIRATDKTPARQADYRSISHAPSDEVYNARDEQLKVRLSELSMLHEMLLRTDRGEEVNNLDHNEPHRKVFHNAKPSSNLLSMFAGKLDVHRPGKISFAGHSFGAATTIQFVKSVFYHNQIETPLLVVPPSEELRSQTTPGTHSTLLDPWGMPLQSPATSALKRLPMPCFSSSASKVLSPDVSPVLAILSSAFYNWTGNLNQVKAALANSNSSEKQRRAPIHIFYPKDSAHLSQSDFGVLFPNVTKYVAKAAEPERILRLNTRAMLEVLRRNDIEVADTTAADMELTGENEKDGQVHGDRKILSTEEGAVRGWISVSADQDRSLSMTSASRQKSQVSAAAADGLGADELAGAK